MRGRMRASASLWRQEKNISMKWKIHFDVFEKTSGTFFKRKKEESGVTPNSSFLYALSGRISGAEASLGLA
jgi:Holliday junction resolvase-like predicted endonuclease